MEQVKNSGFGEVEGGEPVLYDAAMVDTSSNQQYVFVKIPQNFIAWIELECMLIENEAFKRLRDPRMEYRP